MGRKASCIWKRATDYDDQVINHLPGDSRERIKKKNMNIDKLERANILAKSLIPKVDELLNMSSKSNCGRLADAICVLSECDEEFKTKFKQLLNETKQRFQKEFNEL